MRIYTIVYYPTFEDNSIYLETVNEFEKAVDLIDKYSEIKRMLYAEYSLWEAYDDTDKKEISVDLIHTTDKSLIGRYVVYINFFPEFTLTNNRFRFDPFSVIENTHSLEKAKKLAEEYYFNQQVLEYKTTDFIDCIIHEAKILNSEHTIRILETKDDIFYDFV